VGVREIARAAGVNISMISYYFHGKAGILKAILEEYFKHYFEVLKIIDDETKSREECVKILVRDLINYLKKNTEIAMVAYNAIPLELPEIDQWKQEKLVQSMKRKSRLVARFGLDPNDIIEVGTIGPALIAIVFTKFTRLNVIKKLWHLEIDDALYERYAETVADLFLHGITGIASQKRKEKG